MSCSQAPAFVVTASPTRTPVPTPIIMPSPAPLPEFLREVRPLPSSIISYEEYSTVITDTGLYIGPPAPAIEITGLRSSICFDLDVEALVEPGDLLFFEEEVLPRTEVIVDGRLLTERAETDYLASYEPGPDCRCFYDCEEFKGYDWYFDKIVPENVGCWFYPGFWACYPVGLEAGIHNVLFKFNKTSGEVEEYSWQFAITE